MTNFLLLNESISDISFACFQEGLDDLVQIDTNNSDLFHKNPSVYDLDNYLQLCSDSSQQNQFRIQYLEQIENSSIVSKTVKDLMINFSESATGFIGIDFPKLDIDLNSCVSNQDTYNHFKKYYITLIDHQNFHYLKNICFPKLVFCDNSEIQLKSLGTGKKFYQCIDQFSMLQNYLNDWFEGDFSYQKLKQTTAIDLSPESKTTMNLYSQHRVFQLPEGGTEIFELHIKLGDIRIHILEDNEKKIIRIGYVGGHLPI